MGTRDMSTNSFIPTLVYSLCLLSAVYTRGIGTPVTPVSDQYHAVPPHDHDEVGDLLSSWIIPRLISMKYAEPYKVINKQDKLEVKQEKPFWNGQWLNHPTTMRGKKSDEKFFPFPDYYLKTIASGRQARSIPVNMDKIKEVVLPWEMKYFSPMLRG